MWDKIAILTLTCLCAAVGVSGVLLYLLVKSRRHVEKLEGRLASLSNASRRQAKVVQEDPKTTAALQQLDQLKTDLSYCMRDLASACETIELQKERVNALKRVFRLPVVARTDPQLRALFDLQLRRLLSNFPDLGHSELPKETEKCQRLLLDKVATCRIDVVKHIVQEFRLSIFELMHHARFAAAHARATGMAPQTAAIVGKHAVFKETGIQQGVPYPLGLRAPARTVTAFSVVQLPYPSALGTLSLAVKNQLGTPLIDGAPLSSRSKLDIVQGSEVENGDDVLSAFFNPSFADVTTEKQKGTELCDAKPTGRVPSRLALRVAAKVAALGLDLPEATTPFSSSEPSPVADCEPSPVAEGPWDAEESSRCSRFDTLSLVSADEKASVVCRSPEWVERERGVQRVHLSIRSVAPISTSPLCPHINTSCAAVSLLSVSNRSDRVRGHRIAKAFVGRQFVQHIWRDALPIAVVAPVNDFTHVNPRVGTHILRSTAAPVSLLVGSYFVPCGTVPASVADGFSTRLSRQVKGPSNTTPTTALVRTMVHKSFGGSLLPANSVVQTVRVQGSADMDLLMDSSFHGLQQSSEGATASTQRASGSLVAPARGTNQTIWHMSSVLGGVVACTFSIIAEHAVPSGTQLRSPPSLFTDTDGVFHPAGGLPKDVEAYLHDCGAPPATISALQDALSVMRGLTMASPGLAGCPLHIRAADATDPGDATAVAATSSTSTPSTSSSIGYFSPSSSQDSYKDSHSGERMLSLQIPLFASKPLCMTGCLTIR